MPLNVILRELREQAELTQAELAHKSGVPLGTVCRYEQGATADPSFLAIMKMVHAAGGNLADVAAALFAEDPEQPLPKRKSSKRRKKP